MKLLPLDVMTTICGYLSKAEQYQLVLVSKHWSCLLYDMKELSISPTNLAHNEDPLHRILDRCNRLQKLKLACTDRSSNVMESVVKIAQSFMGLHTLRTLESPSSAILKGAQRCPQLTSLVLNEDMLMPISHILESDYENGIALIFIQMRLLKFLDLDCPLLWAINRFIQWTSSPTTLDSKDWTEVGYDEELENERLILADDIPNLMPFAYPILQKLQEMRLRSFNADTLMDFFKGFVYRATIPKCTLLHLSANGVAGFSRNYFKWIRDCFPSLQALELTNISLESSDFKELFECANGYRLRLQRLQLKQCEISLSDVKIRPGNLAHGLTALIVEQMPGLDDLCIEHCIFRNILGYPGTFDTIGNGTETHTVMKLPDASADCKDIALTRLSLTGFGKNLNDAAFIAKYVTLQYLRLDDLPTNVRVDDSTLGVFEYFGIMLKSLKKLELKFTKETGISNVNESADTLYKSLAAATTTRLTVLSLYAPSSIISVLQMITKLPALKDLKLSYIQYSGNLLEDAMQAHVDIRLYALKCLTVHTHEGDASSTALSLLMILVVHSGATRLSDLRVEATHSIAQRASTNLFPMDATSRAIVRRGEINADLMTQVMKACPRIHTLRISGIMSTPESLHRIAEVGSWVDTLVSLEINIQGTIWPEKSYDQALETLLQSHRQLLFLELVILSDRQFTRGIDIGGRDSIHGTQQADALMQRMCSEYRDKLLCIAWWLTKCSVCAPSLRNEKIRSFLLQRIALRRDNPITTAA